MLSGLATASPALGSAAACPASTDVVSGAIASAVRSFCGSEASVGLVGIAVGSVLPDSAELVEVWFATTSTSGDEPLADSGTFTTLWLTCSAITECRTVCAARLRSAVGSEGVADSDNGVRMEGNEAPLLQGYGDEREEPYENYRSEGKALSVGWWCRYLRSDVRARHGWSRGSEVGVGSVACAMESA